MKNNIVWVDIPVVNLERSISFYSAILGVPVATEGGDGFTIGLFPHTEEEVGGCLYTPGEDNSPSRKGPLIYLNAEGRLAEAVRAAGANGGQVLEPVHSIGPHGFRAIILDSEGNRLALHSETE
ncbi:MAG: VOC family protein [Ignavibacteria bacterium]|nr:VOC family protein [Ignavibacteria bacterium]